MPDSDVIEKLTDKTLSNKEGAASSNTLDLTTKVKVGNTELTIEDLLKIREKAQSLEAQIKEQAEIVQAAQVLYGKNSADVRAQEAAYRQLLLKNGYAPDEVESEVRKVYAAPEDSRDKGSPSADRKIPAGSVTTEEQSEALLTKQAVVEGIRARMWDQAEKSLRDDALFKEYAEHIRARDGDEAANSFVDMHVQQVYNELEAAASRKIDETGTVKFLFGKTLQEMAGSSVKVVVGKARQYLGDPKRLGRTAEVSGEDPYFAVKKSDPVAPVKFKPGMGVGQLEESLDRRIADRLSRDVLKAVDPSAGRL